MERKPQTLDEFLKYIRDKKETHKKWNHEKLSNLLLLTNKLIVDLLFLLEANQYQVLENEYVISKEQMDNDLLPYFEKIFEFTNKVILHYKTKTNIEKSYEELLLDEEEALTKKWNEQEKLN